MIKVCFESLVNLDGPTPGVADSKGGTAMWEDGSAALGDECNISLIYLVENTTYACNVKKLWIKPMMSTFSKVPNKRCNFKNDGNSHKMSF